MLLQKSFSEFLQYLKISKLWFLNYDSDKLSNKLFIDLDILFIHCVSMYQCFAIVFMLYSHFIISLWHL